MSRMGFSRTDDPVADADRYFGMQYDEEQEYLRRLPRCACCHYRIETEECYLINDDLVCPDCLDDHFKKNTDDFLE